MLNGASAQKDHFATLNDEVRNKVFQLNKVNFVINKDDLVISTVVLPF